uniref:Uncharacterized protein n=1 Tax=viral metagenome TaxID=1070528 RepID=A0A6C0CPV6_9ZZZZ
MVAPYSPSQEDFDELFDNLPPFNINCERLKNTCFAIVQTALIGAFFYVITKMSITRTMICN